MLRHTDLPKDLQSCPWTLSLGPGSRSEHHVFLQDQRQLHNAWAPTAVVAAAKQLAGNYPLRPGAWVRMGPRWGITCDLDSRVKSPWPHLHRFLRKHHFSTARKLQEAATAALADAPLTWSLHLNWGPQYVSRPSMGRRHLHRARLFLRLPRERLGRFLWHFCPTYGNPNIWTEMCIEYNQKFGGADAVVLQLVPAEPLAVSWEDVPLQHAPFQPTPPDTCPFWKDRPVSLCWEWMAPGGPPAPRGAPLCPYVSRLTSARWKVSVPWNPRSGAPL